MNSYGLKFFYSFSLIGALASAVTAANWSADFDSPLPATWATAGITEPPGGSSATFSATIDSGVLRLSDVTAARDGGSFSALGGTADVFSDVKVGAVVNVANDTNDDLGVVARADAAVGSGYYGSIDFELGHACITKIKGFSSGIDISCSPNGALGLSSSYYIELSAIGAATTELTLDVYDTAGGTLVQTVAASDDGSLSGFGPAYLSGASGVFMVPQGATIADAIKDPISGTFDDVFSVAMPEPATGSMLLLAVVGLATLRRRVRTCFV